MRIALISVTAEFISIGLRNISSVLKREGIDVSIIFLGKDNNRLLTGEETANLKNFLSGFDLIGLSLTTNYFDLSKSLTAQIKRDLDVPVVWGGIHPTVSPEECLDYADYVCIGEGETFMKLFADRIAKKADPLVLNNLGYKKNGRVTVNPLYPLIEDLDSLPVLDLDESNHFALEDGQVRCLKGNPNYERYVSNQYSIMTSRGCPNSCSYCCNDFFRRKYPGQKYLRKRGISRVIEELKEAKKRMPFIKEINFVDDFFLGGNSREEIRSFAESYKKEIGLPFDVLGFTPGQSKEEIIKLLIDAGMKGVRMGIQSGSDRILSLFNRKHLTTEKILESVKVFHKFSKRMSIGYDFILDVPWQAEGDEQATFDLLLKLPRPFRIAFYSFTAFPGTSLFEKAEQEGILARYRNKNYANIQNSYFNSLFYLFEFNVPYAILRFLAEKSTYGAKLFRPLYLIIRSATGFLKVAYLTLKLYPLLLLTGRYKISRYEVRRGIDNFKKMTGIR